MLEHSLSVEVEASLQRIWTFVSKLENWASSMPGYRTFDAISERESLWNLNIGFGSLVRAVLVRAQVELWREPSEVEFTYRLEKDPVHGDGSFSAQELPNGNCSMILIIRIIGEGPMSGMWEAMGRPILPKMVKNLANSLKQQIENSEAAVRSGS